jgi:rhodanese-related sulfurtransferase
MSELCPSCILRSELCKVEAQLEPLAAEAANASEIAGTFYRAATDIEMDSKRSSEVAELELNMYAAVPDDIRDPVELLAEHIHATLMRVRAMAVKLDIGSDQVQTRKNRLDDSLNRAKVTLSALQNACTEGPKDNGGCSAPRSYRLQANQALGIIAVTLPESKKRITYYSCRKRKYKPVNKPAFL